MKKTILTLPLLAVILTASLNFVSCSKKAELTPVEIKPIVYQNDNLTVQVDPRVELFLIALRLAEIEPFNQNAYGQEYSQYLEGVDKIFAKQKDHPLVKELKSHCKNYKKSQNEILKITRYISDDLTEMTIKQKEIPEDMQVFWKGINLKNFIANFNDFAVSSNFERLWLLYTPQLKSQAINLQEYFIFNKKSTDWVSSYFFDESNIPEYRFNATITSGGNYYLPSPIHEGDKTIFEGLHPPFWTKDNDWNAMQDVINLSACLIHDIIKTNWELFSTDLTRIVTDIYTKNQLTEKVTEDVVQSNATVLITFACLFDYEFIKNDEDVYSGLYNQISTQYLIEDPDKIIAIGDYYKNNRDTYPTFESFVINYLPGVLKDF